jgi:hypothetical protein
MMSSPKINTKIFFIPGSLLNKKIFYLFSCYQNRLRSAAGAGITSGIS